MMFLVFVLKIREKTDDGGAGAELGKAGEEDGGVNHHAGEADFLLRQILGDNKKRGDKADGYSHVVDYRAFNALFDNYAHSVLCFFGETCI